MNEKIRIWNHSRATDARVVTDPAVAFRQIDSAGTWLVLCDSCWHLNPNQLTRAQAETTSAAQLPEWDRIQIEAGAAAFAPRERRRVSHAAPREHTGR